MRLFFWLLLAAVVGPCAVVQAPREIGRWQLATALRLRSAGDKEGAYERLSAAARRFPDSPELFLQRAEWRSEDGEKAEALADVDRMLEAAGDTYVWLLIHGQFLQNAGLFERAVEDWKKIDQLSQRSGNPSRETALNGMAYAQALAKVDLEDALKHARQALELSPNNAAILDTHGYILHLLDRNNEALKDMDKAVKGMDEAIVAAKQVKEAKKKKDAADTVKPISATSSRPKTIQETLAGDPLRAAAVVHYHRALVFKALDRQAGADAEIEVVRQLIGRDPDESLF